eukprot:TRINITY_DN3020_c0_g1_i1.p2 TRINITY_DN3020_c0_g1~~TRINITY_DN3020_c0_g1_i1.p2  ORF type:complete len:547 (+),score=71.94 TRINITY_DN3020_c0_g1_i1:79-1641(+)
MWHVRIFFLYSLITLSQQRALRQQTDNNHAVPITITGKTCKLPVEHAGKLYYSCVPDIDGHLWCPVSENGDWEKCAQQNIHQPQNQQVQPQENVVFHQEKSEVNHVQNQNPNDVELTHEQAHHKTDQHLDQSELNEGHNSTFWMVDNTGRMTVEGLPCVFPILYMGEVLYDCVSDVGGYEWCPTITGSWQRCAGSKDWLHEVAEKYVNQVDDMVVPNVGGWIPPIDSYNNHHQQNSNSQHQENNANKLQHDIGHEENQKQQQQVVVNENPSVRNEQQLLTLESPPMVQTRTKSTLSRKTLVQEPNPNNQDKNSATNFVFAIFAILPVVCILALVAVFAESKFQIFEQTKQQLKNSRYIRKKWVKKHTVQVPVDVEQNAPRNDSQRHLFQDYNQLRSDTQITAIKLSSSEGSTVTRRHTSNPGSQQNQQQQQQNQQQQNQNQNYRPDYHIRRSRSQVHFQDDGNVHSVPSWIQNTDNSFWTDISGGVRNQGFVQNQELPQNWLSALEKVEQIQESRRAQSD